MGNPEDYSGLKRRKSTLIFPHQGEGCSGRVQGERRTARSKPPWFKEETAVAWAEAEHYTQRGETKNEDIKDGDLAGPVDSMSSCCQEKELKEGSLL